MSESFSHIRQRFLRRRTLLKAAGLAGAGSVMPALGMPVRPPVGFEPLPLALGANHKLATGYAAQVLIAWGDSLAGEPPDSFPLSAAAQAARFGYNNDFIAYTPLQGSTRGLLGINHEYPCGHLMFPGYDNHLDAKTRLNLLQVRSEMASVGHSVIEVARTAAGWQVVKDSRYARRIHANTPMNVDGPAAGHALLRTAADPKGVQIRGTLGCCAGGKTPWGTVLIAEENVSDFFSGDNGDADMLAKPHEVFRRWADLDNRFDLSQQPNEMNRFGWIVEYDPRQATQPPVKRTSLGRFEHEGATVVAVPGKPLVVFSGDDAEGRCIFRFVSSGNYDPGDAEHNRTLLADGDLYCAQFADDGSGRWLALRQGEGPLTKENGFPDQATVLVNARRAAQLVGGTPMDRPEGIAAHAVSGRIYVSMTKNKNKKKQGVNAANPRSRNAAGHVLEIIPAQVQGRPQPWSEVFRWDLLVQGGDPAAEGDRQGVYGAPPPAGAWLANPDNLVFDPRGRLWIATDGMNSFGAADGMWCTPISGSERAVPHHFFQCPRGAEMCGPEFTPDGETLFLAVQHPADEKDSSYAKPSTRWPDFKEWLPPRPAVVAVTREGGGMIGG